MQFRLILSLIVAITLFACTPKPGCGPQPCKVPPVNQLQACLDLRRQLIFLGNNDPTFQSYQYTAGNWKSPTRQALLIKRYREFHCDEVLAECSPSGMYHTGGLHCRP